LTARFLLISVEDAQTVLTVLTVLMSPWHTLVGTGILVAAFVVHYSNALWSIYIRRSLRITGWELAQVALGLCIPFLLMVHVVGPA
jgi:adenylate cyclase